MKSVQLSKCLTDPSAMNTAWSTASVLIVLCLLMNIPKTGAFCASRGVLSRGRLRTCQSTLPSKCKACARRVKNADSWGASALQSSGSDEVVSPRQKIAVVGSGAVGLYYGARLLEAGHDVSFIARSDLDFLHRNGLTVDSVDGNMRFDNIKAVGKADEVGEVDWVVMALKTYALQEAPEMIKPLVGPNTRILPIMNGFGIEDKLASSLDPARIFGAMAFVCIYREDGICKHVAYGALQAGHYLDDPAELAIVSNLFAGSNVQFTPVRCLRTARWEKLCWNIPFNGLAVGMGGVSTDKICNDPDLRALAKELMNEVVSASHLDAEARGIPRELRLDREAIVQKMFALTDTMGPYEPSTMIDLIKGRPLEVEYIFSNPLVRAQELKADCKHMQTLISMIRGKQRLLGL